MLEIFEKFNCDSLHRMQGIFTSIFVLQNRLQTAGEKIQTKLSMKQWLLLAMAESCPEPRTLTNLGNLMGCSRQNVKKLTLVLEKQGFVCLQHGGNNSICIELTDKVSEYGIEMEERHLETFRQLFHDFSERELEEFFRLYVKLYAGIERVENYAKELQ